MEEEGRHVSGLVFVALMFLGAGVGLIFDRPDVGGAIGMGLGFLAMAYVRARYRELRAEKTVTLGKTIGSALLALNGLAFIAGGLGLLLEIEIPIRILGGIFAVAIGLTFLAISFRLIRLT
mgnify:CR=1 FL=1